jgi:hypothetical protein
MLFPLAWEAIGREVVDCYQRALALLTICAFASSSPPATITSPDNKGR